MREKFAKRERRGGKAAGYPDSDSRQLADHFAQRRVLAADLVHVGHPQSVERDDARLVVRHGPRRDGNAWKAPQ